MADIFVLPGAQREDDHRRKNVIYLQQSRVRGSYEGSMGEYFFDNIDVLLS